MVNDTCIRKDDTSIPKRTRSRPQSCRLLGDRFQQFSSGPHTYKNSRRKGKVRDFYDRVDAAHYVLDEDYPDAAADATDAQKWQHEASKLAHHKCNVFLAFLADIKSKVELKDPKTLEEFISAAVQVEKSVRDPRKTEEVNEVLLVVLKQIWRKMMKSI